MLLLGSCSQGLTACGTFTLSKYVAAYTDPFLLEVSFNTLVFVLGSSLLSTGLALVLAYLNTRTDIPFKPAFTVLSIVPMMIPHLLFSVSRSEEHTSELQSLMRISYAVFCLKKKNHIHSPSN